MPTYGIYTLTSTMCQHDFEGQRVFQHRNMQKWCLYDNPRIPGFIFEQECIDSIRAAQPELGDMLGLPEHRKDDADNLAGHECEYERVECDIRRIFLAADGTINPGGDRMERSWTVISDQGVRVLKIYGDAGLTARLEQEHCTSPIWRGRWRLVPRIKGAVGRTHT
jgi:hypothetical protein